MSNVCRNSWHQVPNNLIFVRFFAEEAHKANRGGLPIPPLSEILKFSQNPDVYIWVCTTLIKSVIGTQEWNPRHMKELLSNIATRSDEAFLILTIENNYDRWMEESTMGDNEDSRQNLTEARYTNSGSSKSVGKGSSRRYHGWSMEGYKHFNELYNLVTADRQVPNRTMFEFMLRARFAAEYLKRKHRSTQSPEEENDEIFPANDFGVPGSYPSSLAETPRSANMESESSSEDEAEDE
jgi:hypothetical protein